MNQSTRDAFARIAQSHVGKPYAWGTAGPDTFDCSGLVYSCFQATVGLALDAGFRSSQYQWEKLGSRVGPSQGLARGDLLFYDTDDDAATSRATHVGIYVGDGQMVSALNEDEGVVVSVIGKPYWKQRFLGAKRLFTGRSTDKTGQKHPKSKGKQDEDGEHRRGDAPEVAPSTAGNATPDAPRVTIQQQTIGAMTPFRSIGDVTEAQWNTALAGSPIQDVAACYRAALGHTALCLAQAIKESSLGANDRAKHARNPLGLLDTTGQLMVFPSWPLAFAEWRKRITDPSYKGSPGPYFPQGVGGMVPGWDMSLLAFLLVYVGGPRCLSSKGKECANGETYDEGFPKDGMGPNGVPVKDDPQAPSINRYCAQTLDRLRKLLGIADPAPVPGPQPPPQGFQRVSFAGSQVVAYLPTDVSFHVVLTPVGNNRPGDRLTVRGTAQHETGNERFGADALMHSRWQDSGTPGHPDGYVGVHFYVDDTRIIQKIPVTESSIHAGTWERNHTQLSIERCVNRDQADFSRSERNAAYLQAALLKYVVKSTAKDAMYPHREPVGRGLCPVYIGRRWTAFERDVDRIITEELP